ncbi:MAG TPA: thiamine diphosphokinase [Candidatus Limnocylindria bacterium]|jgi:thiamine pyrophosphokinase|nr:thiamine diphosphokinase [Candidatus Limnocylindria bacterium]
MKAIVVAGGDAVPEDTAQLFGADLLIAADSGARWLDASGAVPDLVIGDLDSVDPILLDRLAGAGVGIERHPVEKDASDLELALARAVAAGADDVVLLGALGGRRLDHELANLLLLVGRDWLGHRLRIVRGGTTVRSVNGGETIELSGDEGDLVTLLPIDGDAMGVETRGLRFPLDGEPLQLGRSRGLSNQVEHPPASVSLARGTLLVIETRKEPGT